MVYILKSIAKISKMITKDSKILYTYICLFNQSIIIMHVYKSYEIL